MLKYHVELKIFDPDAPPAGFGPPRTDAPEPVADAVGPTPRAFAGTAPLTLRRQPVRDRVRAGLIRAIVAAAPAPVSDEQVNEVIDEVTSERPLLDWLTGGGLEKLIALVLDLLKLAA
ncbi:MAG TPA: hypothetical protein VGE74_13095 [Gemmata sp.]